MGQYQVFFKLHCVFISLNEYPCNNTCFLPYSTAGKTYTMHGTSSSPGIVPRALQDLFAHIDSMKKQNSQSYFHVEIRFVSILVVSAFKCFMAHATTHSNLCFDAAVSFIELYNSNFRSLVNAKNKKKNSNHKHADSMGSITEDLESNANAIARCMYLSKYEYF